MPLYSAGFPLTPNGGQISLFDLSNEFSFLFLVFYLLSHIVYLELLTINYATFFAFIKYSI